MPKTKRATAGEQVREIAALSEAEFIERAKAQLEAMQQTISTVTNALEELAALRWQLFQELQVREIALRYAEVERLKKEQEWKP